MVYIWLTIRGRQMCRAEGAAADALAGRLEQEVLDRIEQREVGVQLHSLIRIFS
jgi:hypothetical protein